jgi:uncharacterized protein YkwD
MKLMISIDGQVNEFNPDPNLGIVTIGRAETNDVAIKNEKAASRAHATLERTIDGWKLVDQMSANGTSLNGEKVNFAFLKEGDVIQIGASRIQVLGLDPAPGASRAPARTPKRAEAPKGAAALPLPAKGRRAAETAEGEAAPAGPYIPPRKSPVPALVAAVVIVLVLGAGGFVLVTNMGGTTQPVDDQTADRGPESPRQAELGDDEKAALTLASDIMAGDTSTLEKLTELDALQARLKGKRGSKAVSDIGDMKAELVRKLNSEVTARIDTDLATVATAVTDGNFVLAMGTLDELDGWLQGDSYMDSFAKANRQRIDRQRKDAETLNNAFIDGAYQQMWRLADQMLYDEAITVCSDVLERGWFDFAGREVYERELAKLQSLKESYVPPAPPVIEEPKEPAGSLLDRVKKDEGRLPGKNPLLPDGIRSEKALVDALQARFVAAVKDGSLKGKRFKWRGNEAQVDGVTSTGRLRYVYSYIDKKTGEEVPVPASTKFEDVPATEMLNLYDITPNLTDEDRLALVVFCYNNGFMDDAARRAFKLFQARNDWKDGIDILIASKRKINIPTGGFVEYDGTLVTPDERENAVFVANLRSVLDRFEKGVGSKDRRRREDSDKAFAELIEMGERAVQPAIAILQEVLDKEMTNAKKATGLLADDKALGELLVELDRRRAHALDLIMDTVRYPYPYGPNRAEVQADVNERVAAVREIWDNPMKFTGQKNPEFEAVMEKVRAIAERMAQIDPDQTYFKQTPEETVEYIGNIANEALSIRNYTGDNSAKQKLYNHNVKVMQANEDHPTGARHADAESRAQVRITNEYRIMFARHAVRINDKLFWAAHHHSRYCIEHNGGQIAHEIPGEPKGETPGQRMAHEGYTGGGGENIHMNGGGPTAASSHDAWCNSSGHHRNILHPNWRVLGSARWQTIWTQKFGGLDEGDNNAVSRGGE